MSRWLNDTAPRMADVPCVGSSKTVTISSSPATLLDLCGRELGNSLAAARTQQGLGTLWPWLRASRVVSVG
jgi:hypothetical protein